MAGDRRGWKRWRRGVLFLGLALAAALLAGCGGRDVRPAAGITAVDALGRTVAVPKPPERIVSLAPSNTEILFALGLGERVAGVTDYCDYPPEARAKEKVGGFKDPSVEKVISLRPDLVLATGGIQREVVDRLDALGVPVFVLDPRSMDEVLAGIRTVARLAGAAAEGERVAAGLEARVAATRDRTARIPEAGRPAVFYEVWPDPLMTAGPGSFAHDMIGIAGGRNVAAGTAQPYPKFSLEELLAADPAVIVTPFAETARDLGAGRRPGWRGIRAVRDGRIAVVNQDLTSRPGPRLVDGLEAMARAIHPEIFGEGR